MKTQWIPVVAFVSIVLFMMGYQKYDAAQQVKRLEAERATQLKRLEMDEEMMVTPLQTKHNAVPQWQEMFLALETPQAGQTWWLHKHWKELAQQSTSELPQKQLATRVDSSGNLTLLSFFESSYPLQHTQVRVKIGEQVYDSTFVPVHAEIPIGRYDRQVSFKEERSFHTPQDVSILKAIANNTQKTILVQLVGKRFVETFLLSDADKEAIRASVQLAEQLKS